MRKTIGRLQLLLAILIVPFFSWAQKPISGHVLLKSDQSAVPGATITIKGSKTGTYTTVEGAYSIKAKEGDVLVISGVGITTQEVKVGSEAILKCQCCS